MPDLQADYLAWKFPLSTKVFVCLQVWQHLIRLALVCTVVHRVLPAGEEGRDCVAGVLLRNARLALTPCEAGACFHVTLPSPCLLHSSTHAGFHMVLLSGVLNP